MPRPKGSKNKNRIAASVRDIDTLSSQMASVETEIAALNDSLKAKKNELKALAKEKLKAEKLEAAKKAAEEAEVARIKAEEDKQKILDAFKASGKSVEEILAFLK